MTKNPVHWFKFYLLGYALLSLYVGLNIPLTWDEGTHTLADRAERVPGQLVHGLPQLSPIPVDPDEADELRSCHGETSSAWSCSRTESRALWLTLVA